MTFALVHGAWHGARAWDALIPELEACGHRVVAPDLPCEGVNAGAAEYAQLIIDALEGSDDAIVVGRSLGGISVPLVPARTLVYLYAYVPQPGRALIDRGSEAFGPAGQPPRERPAGHDRRERTEPQPGDLVSSQCSLLDQPLGDRHAQREQSRELHQRRHLVER